MRLGQLARKLSLRPGELVEFLAQNNIYIDEGSNTRLDDVHVNLIQQKYAPDLAFDPVPAPVSEDPTPTPEATVAIEERTILKEDDVEKSDEKIGPEEETDHVIKAPKISLSGLKVLGKIDLPEPKKKEDLPQATQEQSVILQEEKKPLDTARTNTNQKRRQHQRQVKNPIALQRDREAQEEKKKRQEKAEQDKEKRKQNYYKKVKMSPPTKAAKLVEEPTMQMSAEELEETPKTWWGRFIKWLTT